MHPEPTSGALVALEMKWHTSIAHRGSSIGKMTAGSGRSHYLVVVIIFVQLIA
jgi:hypothetical protein